MSEMIKNFAIILWLAYAVNDGILPAQAQVIREEKGSSMPLSVSPTIVYGKAQQPDGVMDEVVVEQPDNSDNPLGNPLPNVVEAQPNTEDMVAANKTTTSLHNQQQTEAESADSSQALGSQFQNTLMEANGMVYDIQAYPTQDLGAIGNPSNPETIYSPNVNP